MDEMGVTCDDYLDGKMSAEEFRAMVKEHRNITRALVAEIKAKDEG
jgi:hypothetical protein